MYSESERALTLAGLKSLREYRLKKVANRQMPPQQRPH
jgi:hypothetical protein